ncbi:MAG: hypothetical protein QM767_28330 [Anaeromyxobacter sp.]
MKQELKNLNPGKDVENLCQDKLDSCHSPEGSEFCEWVFFSACGKASCGLSVEDPTAVCSTDTTGTTGSTDTTGTSGALEAAPAEAEPAAEQAGEPGFSAPEQNPQ